MSKRNYDNSKKKGPRVDKSKSPRLERTPGGKSNWAAMVADNINDIEWYARNPQLLMDSASISWFNPLGNTVKIADKAIDGINPVPTTMPSIPGIMALRLMQIPGYAKHNTDAVNIAARNMYSWVRHENSGHANYEPADLMMYILAIDSAYAFVAWMRRLYKELMVSSVYNKYLPIANVKSEGVDYDDLMLHISDLRWYINQYQVRLGAYMVPHSLPYFSRHMYVFSNLYSDDPNQKGQIYKFVPDGYYVWDDANAGSLRYVNDANTAKTFANIVAMGNEILQGITTSEDCGIISGDILRCYGEGGIFKMEPLMPEEIVAPVCNPEMLDQIQNMTIMHDVELRGIAQIMDPASPDNGALICQPGFRHPALEEIPYVWDSPYPITVINPDPNPAQTMILTRLTALASPDTTYETDTRIIDVVGTEICTGGKIYYMTETGSIGSMAMYNTYQYIPYTDRALQTAMMLSAFMRAFDRHPAQIRLSDIGGYGIKSVIDVDIQWSNYTFVAKDVLKRMHESAILSEFDVPMLGSQGNRLV